MKKDVILGFLIGIMITGTSLVLANSQIQAFLNTKIKVVLNGKTQEFRDDSTNELQYPITYNNRTYLPLRNIATLLKLDVEYDLDSDTVLLTNKEKELTTILNDIQDFQKRTSKFHSIKSLSLNEKNIYTCYFEEKYPHLEIYDENCNLLYSGNGDFGESDIYTDDSGNIYYYEYNYIYGMKPTKNQYEKYYLKYENDNIVSYQENTETVKEKIMKFVKRYNEQNPNYMISKVYWSYSDYIKFQKDGMSIDVYYKDGKIKVIVSENTYVDTKDGIRKDLSNHLPTNYKDFIYNLAKIGNENVSRKDVNNIYEDLEEGKYGSKLLSNDIEIDGVRFNYYNQLNYFSTEIEFKFD